ncbi:MAG: carboxypeptidase-like regulatory domain-containing protein [Ignavibacteriales bacterium]|nr:carboxypeptidase-like regulatory domain-containing protein [Ignavibacteriales bacterium]
MAQEGNIRGKVVDLHTREPIPMVNVYLRGSTSGTTTDSSGAFVLSLPAKEKLVVSFSPYCLLERNIRGSAAKRREGGAHCPVGTSDNRIGRSDRYRLEKA